MLKKHLLLSALLIVSVGLITGCFRQSAIVNLHDLPAVGSSGRNLSAASVKQAIIAGARTRGWVARELSPGVITATLAVRAHTAEVEIPYNSTSYSIVYKNSNNLKYQPSTQTIHSQYNTWIVYLHQAIESQLAVQ
ncbi:MAG: hypothetical protein LBT47_05525 [Deltaproteobacteria bacterium]|jgi:hypothetical protein|nr:hypothetical protein [Deltaproteobacteria bacterium]